MLFLARPCHAVGLVTEPRSNLKTRPPVIACGVSLGGIEYFFGSCVGAEFFLPAFLPRGPALVLALAWGSLVELLFIACSPPTALPTWGVIPGVAVPTFSLPPLFIFSLLSPFFALFDVYPPLPSFYFAHAAPRFACRPSAGRCGGIYCVLQKLHGFHGFHGYTNDDKRYADGLVSIVPRVRKIEDLLSDQLASRWKFSGVAPRSLPPQGEKKKSNQLSSAEIEKIIDFEENPIKSATRKGPTQARLASAPPCWRPP